jgi:alcohol dehydrogenase class IV
MSRSAEDFSFLDSERLIRFGRTALDDATRLLPERGFEDFALLTTPRAAEQAPAVVEQAATVLNVPQGGVPEGAAAVRDEVGGRPVVALGGGRVVDASKAIGGADGLPVAAIPTTLSGAPITRIHRMPEGVDRFTLVRPSLVIADPQLMASQPMPHLAASAMNALAHATESLYTPLANPVSTMAALRAAELFASGLADPRDPRRDDLALAAVLGSWAMGTTGYAVHHVVCQTLVRVAGTPHAETNAVILPHTVRFMAMRAPNAIEALRKAIGGDVADLAATAGPTTLGELGVDAPKADAVADAAAGRPELGNTPGGPPSADRLRAFLHAAL